MPISCHSFRYCKALLVVSLLVYAMQCYSKYPDLYLYLCVHLFLFKLVRIKQLNPIKVAHVNQLAGSIDSHCL